MRVMLLGAIIFLAVGILSAFFPLSFLIALIIVSVALTVLFSLIKKPQLKMGQVFCFFLAAAFSIYLFNNLAFIKPLEKFDGKEIKVQGVIIEEAEKNISGYGYLLKISEINGETYKGKIRIFSESGEIRKRGDEIKISVIAETPKDTLFEKSRLTSFGKGVYLLGEATKDMEYVGKDKAAFIYEITDRISAFISEDLPEREGDLLSGVLLNEKDKLSASDRTVLTDAGYSHLINVSGLHMSIIASIIFTFFEALLKRKRKIAVVLTIMGIVLYMVLSGFSVSAMRAGLMLILYYAAFLSYRRSDSLNSLGAAVVIILCFNPFAAYDASFLLSVFSTFGIIYMGIYFNKISEKIKSEKLKSVISFMLPSFSALIFSAPVLAILFGEINLISPISNLFLYIFITPLLAAGLVFVLTKFIGFSFLSDFLAFVLRLIGKVVFLLAEIFSKATFLSLGVFSLGAKILISLLVLWLITALIPMKRRKRKRGNISFISLIILSVSLIGLEIFHNNKESIYIVSSGEETAIISSCNGEYSVLCPDGIFASRAAESFLKSRGVKRLETIYIYDESDYAVSAAVKLNESIPAENILVSSKKVETMLKETSGLNSVFASDGIRLISYNYLILHGGEMETHIDRTDRGKDKIEIKTNSDSVSLTIAKFSEKVYYRYNGTLISEDTERIYRLQKRNDKILIKEVKRLGFDIG